MAPKKPVKYQDEDRKRPRNALPSAILNDLQDEAILLEKALQDARNAGELNEKLLANALRTSVETNRPNCAKLLLSHGIKADARHGNGQESSLMSCPSAILVNLLLDCGADVNATDTTGRTPLMHARKEQVAAALVQRGAGLELRDAKGQTALAHAVSDGKTENALLLIGFGADVKSYDGLGRTLLMTAAWKNRVLIAKSLIEHGALVNATDGRGRSVLHHICKDDERAERASKGSATEEDSLILNLILTANVEVNAKAKKDGGKSAMHIAVAANNRHVLHALLKRTDINVNTVDHRNKTPLHIAAANGRRDVAMDLLHGGANVRAESDGRWTPLHVACDCRSNSLEAVRLLLSYGADPNSVNAMQKSPLHIAAEADNYTIVECLLEQPGIDVMARDLYGDTPLLCAAKLGKVRIIKLLAPRSHATGLSDSALDAAKGFKAPIVDFQPRNARSKNGHVRSEKLVYDLLSGISEINLKRPSAGPKDGQQSKLFRWIHLPANNISWCQEILVRQFMERDSWDVENFKQLEFSLNHQHRAQQPHAHYLRPTCQTLSRVPVARMTTEPEASSKLPRGIDEEGSQILEKSEQVQGYARAKPSESPQKKRKPSLQMANRLPPALSMYLFMPYLHYETTRSCAAMEREIRSARKAVYKPVRNSMSRPAYTPEIPMGGLTSDRRTTDSLSDHPDADKKLIHAHVNASECSLHVRRTLDQFFYRTADTRLRDRDQIVLRHQKKHPKSEDSRRGQRLIMVDQLWMWIVNDDLIITSFPERWERRSLKPGEDQHNVFEGIMKSINSPTREIITDVYELSAVVAGHVLGAFDRNPALNETLFLEMFETALGDAMDREAQLFSRFKRASKEASRDRGADHFDLTEEWPGEPSEEQDTENGTMSVKEWRNPTYIQTLLDIRDETELLGNVKDIQDELGMLKMILTQQQKLFKEMEAKLAHSLESNELSKMRIERAFETQMRHITDPLEDIERMEDQAERTYISVTNLLDLKQKHANSMQAAETSKSGKTIMLFTIVTVIFLPLSFLAALFAVNITAFPQGENGNPSMSLGYVSKYVFGIGVGIAALCVVFAFSIERLEMTLKKWTSMTYHLFATVFHKISPLGRSKSASTKLMSEGSPAPSSLSDSTQTSTEETKEVRFRNPSNQRDVEHGLQRQQTQPIR